MQLRKLVYTSDVTTLLQDGLEKVVEGYTTFEEVLKQIEFENSEEDKGSTYDLNHAIEYTNLSQTQEKPKVELKESKPEVSETKKEDTQPKTQTEEADDWGLDFTEPSKPEVKPEKKEEKKEVIDESDDDDLLNMEF